MTRNTFNLRLIVLRLLKANCKLYKELLGLVAMIGAWKKIWHFVWHEESLASWLVNLVLSFVLVKWVIYPGVGFLLGTSYPIVAVVSSSMEHNGLGFEDWWEKNGGWYMERGITQEDFGDYSFTNGFNKGDIMVLKGIEPKAIKMGMVVVYEHSRYNNPIIHRVVQIREGQGALMFVTKGDNNFDADTELVREEQIQRTGKAIFRLPLLGWVKILFVELIGVFRQ